MKLPQFKFFPITCFMFSPLFQSISCKLKKEREANMNWTSFPVNVWMKRRTLLHFVNQVWLIIEDDRVKFSFWIHWRMPIARLSESILTLKVRPELATSQESFFFSANESFNILGPSRWFWHAPNRNKHFMYINCLIVSCMWDCICAFPTLDDAITCLFDFISPQAFIIYNPNNHQLQTIWSDLFWP